MVPLTPSSDQQIDRRGPEDAVKSTATDEHIDVVGVGKSYYAETVLRALSLRKMWHALHPHYHSPWDLEMTLGGRMESVRGRRSRHVFVLEDLKESLRLFSSSIG
jgi:hypothetical protein